MNPAVPKKLASYMQEMGAQALNHLADTVAPPEEGAAPDAVQALVDRWRSMSTDEKYDFVTRVSAAVGEVVAASALLPVGMELGRKAVKSARKVLKRSAKSVKKKAKKTIKKNTNHDDGKSGKKKKSKNE